MTEFKIIGYNNDRPSVIDDITCSLTGAMLMPRGISDERPPSAVQGMLRYNTEEHYFEYFSGETNSWSPISDLPSGTNGDVIISDGSGGLNSTNKLNVNPSNGTITATGALTVVGGVGIGENLNVANTTTTTNLTVTDQLDASGVDISNNLNVANTTTTTNLTVYNQLDASGVDISNNLNVGGTLNITGDSTLSTLDVTGNVGLSSSLGIVIDYDTIHQIPGTSATIFGFGLALSRDGKSIAVGSIRDGTGGNRAGAVYVYTRTDLSQTWTQKGTGPVILSTITYDHMGWDVAISDDGNTVAGISILLNVTVAKYSGGSWTTVSISPPYTQLLTTFEGAVLDINASGTILLITSMMDSSQGTQYHGSAWVFEYNNSTWTQKGSTIHGSTTLNFDALGERNGSLSKDGLTFSIGSKNQPENNGEVTVYVWNEYSLSWTPKGSPITGTSNNDGFYLAKLSDDGNTLLISAMGNWQYSKVYEWNESSSSWTQKGGNINTPLNLAFLSRDATTIGVPEDIYGPAPIINIYKYTSNSWTISKIITSTAPNQSAWGQFLSFTADGKHIATGAFNASTPTIYTYSTAPDYGSIGQVLTSDGSGNPVSWTTPTSAFGAFNLAFNFTITSTKAINNIINNTTFPPPFGMTLSEGQNIQLTQAGVYRFTWCLSFNYTNSGTSLAAFFIKRGTTIIHRSDIWLSDTWGTISGSRDINVTAGQTFYFEGQTVSGFVLRGGNAESSISITRLF